MTGAAPPGKVVHIRTVRALLGISLRQVLEAQYLFCRTATCPVVYFSQDRSVSFTTSQIQERVYQKEPNAADVFICYCFRHTVSSVRDAGPGRRLEILADLNTGIQRNECACDLRNPQGSCCLGNVPLLIKEAVAQAPPPALAA